MDDLISRQAAIDALRAIKHGLWEIDIPSPTVPEYVEHHEQIKNMMEIVDGWIKRIKEEPAADVPDKKIGKWIPCKKKLPQEDEPVLVTDDVGDQHVWNITRNPLEYLDGLCWEDDYGYYQDLDDAVAWQPLSEPYKGEEDGTVN